MRNNAIVVRDLRVRYGQREILHGINFEVPANETLVILGGSGSGKSTLLRTLVGLETPSSGEIWIRGKNFAGIPEPERDELRKKMGMSFQSGALFGSMTVGENVALPLREHTELDESTIQIIVRLKLDQVGLSGFENFMPSQLSGGMKKRAAVARALAMDPEILFFDEPSAGLDPIIAAGLDELILRLKKAFQDDRSGGHPRAGQRVSDRRPHDPGQQGIHCRQRNAGRSCRRARDPRVRQFLDRVPEPEMAGEIDYLQMLTGETPPDKR